MFHNNFGICAQASVSGSKEGLSRVSASVSVQQMVNGPLHTLESYSAEIAVYNNLVTVGPNHKPYVSDLYSIN